MIDVSYPLSCDFPRKNFGAEIFFHHYNIANSSKLNETNINPEQSRGIIRAVLPVSDLESTPSRKRLR